MSAIRYTRGNLQVPCKTFTNGKRTIVLCGVAHVAERTFWEDTTKRIGHLETAGFEVHYELISNDMENPPKLGLDYEAIAALFALQGQKQGLTYKPTWKRTDITSSQLFAESDLAKGNEMGEKAQRGIEQVKELEWKPTWFFRAAMKAVLIMSTLIKQKTLAGVPRTILVDQRNGVALAAALRTNSDVVAIWGAEHLAGISAGLKAHGFKHIRTTWTTAIAAKPEQP